MVTPEDSEHARLKLAREAKDMTQGELGELVGIERLSVSRHENGGRISPRIIPAYCEALGCTEEWLRFGVGPGPGQRRRANQIVREYLAGSLGRTCSPDVARMLQRISYPQLGVRRLTEAHVHRVRELIEMNRVLASTMTPHAEPVPDSKPSRRRR